MLSILLSLILAAVPLNAPDKAHCGKSGATLFLVSAKPLGAREPTVPVITTPTLAVNGQAVPMVAGPVSGGFWSFSLARPVNPADSLRVTAPAGWAAGMPALDLSVRNSAGRLEFPVPERPTMGLGVNISGVPLAAGSLWCPIANWATRLWPFYGADTNANGDVTRMIGTSISAPFYFGTTSNGIDAKGYPSPGNGLWTVTWDSPDPQTDLGLSERWGPPNGWQIKDRPELSSPGKDGVGITKVFEVSPLPTSANRAPILQLDVRHPKGTPNYSGLWITPPGSTTDRSDPLAMESWTQRCLSVGAGKGPSVIRWIDSASTFGNQSNAVTPEHLTGIGTTAWTAGPRSLSTPVARLRPLDLAVSPNILTVSGPVPIPTREIWGTGGYVAEAVCDQPHGLGNGQPATILLPNVTVAVGGKPQTPGWLRTSVWVTSPTTFVVLVGSVASPTMLDIDATVETPGATAEVTILGSQPPIPYEFAAAATGRFDGCAMWLPIPPLANNDLVDEIARRVLRCLPPGRWVIPELGCENWNWWFMQSGYCSVMGRLTGLTQGYWPDQYSAKRQAEVAARFASVFSREGRAGDVKLILATQFGYMSRGLLDWAAANGIKADIVSGAMYWNLLPQWGPLTKDWSAPQIQDLFRTFLVHDSWTRQMWAEWSDALARYETAIGRKVLRYSYEGGTENAVSGMPGGGLAARAVDVQGHPDAADTERVHYWQCQANGVDVFTYYTMVATPGSDGSNWGLWNWQGQPTGPGLANPRIGTSGEWRPMESVRGHAWREWQRSYLLSR